MRRALAFLTPLGGPAAPSPSALRWFPAVGAALGLGLGLVWAAADRLWPALVAAAVVVAADMALTGMLHLDGLVDAADGLLPHLPPERRLEVMDRPDAGAFGMGAAGAALLLRWSALATMPPAPLLLAGLWCLSRTAMAVAATTRPYARPDGLATAFLGASLGRVAVAGAGAAVVASYAGRGGPGVAAVIVAAGAAAGVVALAQRRLGGFTGDVLGAAGMVGETAGLLVAAGRW